jgi:hypothetical protein
VTYGRKKAYNVGHRSKFNFDLHEHEEFVGDSNPLVFESGFELNLGCDFDLRFYPFDTQHCFIMVSRFGAATISIMTFSITTLSIMTFSITMNETRHSA